MIYQSLNKYDFVQAFDAANRADNFTVAAREALYDYYMDLAESLGEPVELDVIAICCDWTEYTEEEIHEEFGLWGHVGWLAVLEDEMEVIIVEQGRSAPDTCLVPN